MSAPPRTSVLAAEASESRTGKGFQSRMRAAAAQAWAHTRASTAEEAWAKTHTRAAEEESATTHTSASEVEESATTHKPASTAVEESATTHTAVSRGRPPGRGSRSPGWAAAVLGGTAGAAAARTSAAAAEAWAKSHTGSAAEPAEAARTEAAAEPAGAAARTPAAAAEAWAKSRTGSAAGSDQAAVRMDSGPVARTVPIQIRAAGSSDTPLAVDCGQPSGTGFHLRVCSRAEPGPTHIQVHPLVRASTPATTSAYVPLIGIAMR